jgi:outer membrane protein assembly factor BamB
MIYMLDENNIFQRIRAIWNKNRKIVYILGAFLLIWFIIMKLTDRFQLPKLSREVDFSSENLREGFNFPQLELEADSVITASDKGIVFVSGDKRLASFDPFSGVFLWQVQLPGDRNSWLTFTGESLLGTTALDVVAYDASTGESKWSTGLGPGHVSFIAQLDNDIFRVYYGEQIFELDRNSGAIHGQRPRGNLEWIQGDIELYRISPGLIGGKDRKTGDDLWQIDAGAFDVMRTSPAQFINNQSLFIRFSRKICLLNINSGKYLWCRPDVYISNVGLTFDRNNGYLLRDDFVLEKIDLNSGKVVGETQFMPRLSDGQNDLHLPESFITITDDGTVIIIFGDSNQLIGLRNTPN